MAHPDCAFCDRPDPRDSRRIPLITPDGAHQVCGLCILQLLNDRRVQVTVMLEPAPVPAS